MRTIIIAWGLTMITAVAYCQTEEEEIKAALTDMWDAIENNDIERYASHLHPVISVFGETNPYLAEGKELEVSNVKGWLDQSSGVHTEMHQPVVTIQGSVAWIVYYWTDSGTTQGEFFSSRGKSTRIFVKEGEHWLCIHAHHTLVE